MARRRGGFILMVLGVILALGAGGIVWVVTSTAAAPAEVPKRNVVVARVDIPERTLIDQTMVVVQQWPQDIVPVGAPGTAEEVVGKFTLTKLYAKQALLTPQLADTKGQAGMAFALEPGKVLVAVNYPGALNILGSGAIRPGDKVDIVVNSPGSPASGAKSNQVSPTFRNLQIVAIGTVAQAKAGAPAPPATGAAASTLIFMVTPQEALELKFLETMGVDLLLRAAGDEAVPATQLVDIDYIVDKYRLEPPPKAQ